MFTIKNVEPPAAPGLEVDHRIVCERCVRPREESEPLDPEISEADELGGGPFHCTRCGGLIL